MAGNGSCPLRSSVIGRLIPGTHPFFCSSCLIDQSGKDFVVQDLFLVNRENVSMSSEWSDSDSKLDTSPPSVTSSCMVSNLSRGCWFLELTIIGVFGDRQRLQHNQVSIFFFFLFHHLGPFVHELVTSKASLCGDQAELTGMPSSYPGNFSLTPSVTCGDLLDGTYALKDKEKPSRSTWIEPQNSQSMTYILNGCVTIFLFSD